ncbi:dTDP-glucose 4,6-dehydratase [Granulosicoccus antarcticus]|uniref:dTDP-glucose 4,6-dehydratase n=1 Tax=Granulosicoccus antarcticus IMCC3135 TaxID=1192854 RepID=A0A2Z2NKN1_9GAMM|nr:dTDP-glucose 4,6-dehydratase [Granulosicoccus antarcticus]ASJ71703.1 dTDP-glucose 4,6-dehydratase 2 [Granulosicoccus antarcticus IMCC3135]
MRRMLVTGAAGFIGANFVRYWLDAYPEDVIVVVDALTYAGNRANLEGVLSDRCSLVECDINNTETIKNLLREQQLTTIVHFAAESHVDRSIEGPDAFIEANILGTHSLLKAARAVWQTEGLAPEDHRFHHVSTDEVYGTLSLDDPAFTETTAYAPNSPYSASKASSDFLVRSYHHTYGLNVTTSNCSNNYGPFHFPEKLIPLIIINLLHGKSLPIYGDGKNIRDWLYVEDHARGIERVLNKGQVGETYNIGGVNEWTNIDIVKLICELMDERFSADPELKSQYPGCPAAAGQACDSLITYVTDRAGHDFRYAIDTTRIRDELGYTPAITFEEGIRKTLDWYLARPDWWRAVLDGSYRNAV